ncbi:MAG: alpha/beta fold hydrolase [Gammaproteobacteria bacterium]
MNKLTDQRFQSSTLNCKFNAMGLPFDEYIKQTQNTITRSRTDLNSANCTQVIAANSPCEHVPHTGKATCAIVLLHGFLDSPAVMSSLFEHYRNKNYLVRSLLLPGHGTRPGDLLHVQLEEWIKASKYTIDCCRRQADKVIVIGFSAGASLAILQAYCEQNCDALVLFAPAIRVKSKIAYYSHWIKLLSGRWQRARWANVGADNDYSKYQSFPFNAVHQIARLSQLTIKNYQRRPLGIPQFVIMTNDDEVIDPKSILQYFQAHQDPYNRMVVYSNQDLKFSDPRVSVTASAMMEKNILDYSHVCLPVAPEHNHYGESGNYTDFFYHQSSLGKHFTKNGDAELFFGANSLKHLKKYNLARLRYNPRFNALMTQVDCFIEKVVGLGTGTK